MMSYEKKINKITKFIFNITNLDTVFIDSKSKIQIYYGYFQVPKLLKPYLRNVYDLLELDNSEFNQNIVIHKTSYKLNFISVKLFKKKEFLGSIIIGPYLCEEPNKSMIDNIIYRHNISISIKNPFYQYYTTIPIYNIHKSNIISEFLAFSVTNIDILDSFEANLIVKEYREDFNEIQANTLVKNTKEHLLSIKERYHQENEIMYAVENGDLDKVYQIMEDEKMAIHNSSQRIPDDPLRSNKNISIVFNTLLRKSVEKGGLHPMDIHSISEKYAKNIEQATTINQLKKITDDMKFDYCNAVKRFTLKKYSLTIRKAIDYIRKNIDSDLSLNIISSAIGVSPSELSRKFKKETQESIVSYINILRINEAIHLMGRGEYSITEIAFMVGFNDANYFTKVFKKNMGVSPSEYRTTL